MDLISIRNSIAAEIMKLQKVHAALDIDNTRRTKGVGKTRTMSAKGRAAIRRAQKARWAKVRASKGKLVKARKAA